MAKKRKSRKQTQPLWPAAGVAGEPGWQPVPGVRLRMTLRGHERVVFRIAWSPDGRRLASPSEDKTIRIWDAVTGEVVRTLEGHSDIVFSVAWSPDGRRLASAADDKTVRLWDAETGHDLRTLEGHSGSVWSVAWSPDGRRLASASDDKTVRLWDADTGQATNVLEGHTGSVKCAAISADARMIASKGGSKDNTVRLWRCDTWQPVAVIPEPASGFWPPGVAIHPHEPLLATVGSDPGAKKNDADELIHIWELDYAVLLGEQRSRGADRSRTRKSSEIGSLAASCDFRYG